MGGFALGAGEDEDSGVGTTRTWWGSPEETLPRWELLLGVVALVALAGVVVALVAVAAVAVMAVAAPVPSCLSAWCH